MQVAVQAVSQAMQAAVKAGSQSSDAGGRAGRQAVSVAMQADVQDGRSLTMQAAVLSSNQFDDAGEMQAGRLFDAADGSAGRQPVRQAVVAAASLVPVAVLSVSSAPVDSSTLAAASRQSWADLFVKVCGTAR